MVRGKDNLELCQQKSTVERWKFNSTVQKEQARYSKQNAVKKKIEVKKSLTVMEAGGLL